MSSSGCFARIFLEASGRRMAPAFVARLHRRHLDSVLGETVVVPVEESMVPIGPRAQTCQIRVDRRLPRSLTGYGAREVRLDRRARHPGATHSTCGVDRLDAAHKSDAPLPGLSDRICRAGFAPAWASACTADQVWTPSPANVGKGLTESLGLALAAAGTREVECASATTWMSDSTGNRYAVRSS